MVNRKNRQLKSVTMMHVVRNVQDSLNWAQKRNSLYILVLRFESKGEMQMPKLKHKLRCYTSLFNRQGKKKILYLFFDEATTQDVSFL